MTETNMILTPKNIYRVLTSKQARRDLYMPGALDGLTLVGFWRDLLTDVLPQSALNTLLPADGSHPRVQSSLMNRTGPNSLPRLMREHLPLTQTGLVLLTRNAARFLLGRGYHPATFAAYMNSFEEGCTEADVFITAPVRDYLNSIRSFGNAVPEESSRRLVADSFRLAWLSLFALYGSEMNCDKLNHLRRDPENTFEIICSLVTDILKKTAVITGGNCVLYRAPLPPEQYIPFGLTPTQVIGHLEHSGKVYLSGIDGCGKTELARQVLAILKRRSAYSRIACVQYDKSLEASFAAAFADLSGADCIKSVKALLESSEEGRALLIIDNVNTHEDAGLDVLACFNCDILMTGHLTTFDGVETVTVPSMTEQEGIALLSLSVGRGLEKEEMEEAKALVRCVHGHPLMLTLLGSLCRTRFWKIEELKQHLDEFGMMNLIDSPDLNAVANSLYRVLPAPKLRPLIRLISVLGYRSWKPAELLEYACDITDSEKELSAQLNSLNTEGWLVWNEDGYLMHPVIAENLRQEPGSCDEYPKLWQKLSKMFAEPMTEKKQSFVPQAENLLRYTANLDRTALSLIIGLQQSVMTRPTGSITDDLPKLHCKWLDTHDHTAVDEIDYHIMQLLWAILRSRPGQYRNSAKVLSTYEKKDLLSTSNYTLLLNVLQVGGKYADPDELNALFEQLRPDSDDRMVDYCNFLGGKLREVDRNQQRAAEVLQQGRELIEKLGLTGTLQEAANDSRMAYTLADMGRWSETLPLMRRVMDNMKKRGYADDSPTVTPIRSTYHFFLSKCGEYQQARKELNDHLKQVIEKDERFEAIVRAYNSYMHLLMDHDEFEEGEKVARNLIAYCRGCTYSDPEHEGEAFLAGGQVLLRCGKPEEAIGLLAEAQSLFDNVDEGSVLQCRFYISRCLAALGRADKASAMLKNVHNMLLKRHEGNQKLLTLVEQAESAEMK